MPFKKGKPKTGGRKPGVQNTLTKTVKDTVMAVFDKLQEDPEHNLLQFAKDYPRDFYNIAAKLIPNEIENKVDIKGGIRVVMGKKPE